MSVAAVEQPQSDFEATRCLKRSCYKLHDRSLERRHDASGLMGNHVE